MAVLRRFGIDLRKAWRSSPLMRYYLIIVTLLLCSCAGQSPQAPGSADQTPQVLVSIAPYAEMAERLLGADVAVGVLLPAAADPHAWSPSDADIERALGARVLVHCGVPYESAPWFVNVLEQLPEKRRAALSLDSGHDHDHHDHHDHHHDDHHHDHSQCGGGADPHTWMNPHMLRIQAIMLRPVLMQAFPELSEQIEERSRLLDAELVALDEQLKVLLEPYKGRSVFVHHPAWGHFCNAYGLKQVAVEVEGREPSDAELTAFQEQVRAAQARVLVLQPQRGGPGVQRIADALGLTVLELDPLRRDLLANLAETGAAFARALEP